MSILTKIILLVIALFCVPLALVMGAFIRNDLPWNDPPGFFKRLQQYTTTNVAETTTESTYPELTLREYDLPAEQLFKMLQVSVNQLGWEITGHRDETYSIMAVVTTPLRRYKDDVAIRLLPLSENRNQLYIRSNSREGHGDLGTNTRHILDLYQQLELQVDN
jgi:uncharacterized protein (DUF1499 family)